MQIKVNEDVPTGPILIDLFIHGHYLHEGNAKSDQLEASRCAALAPTRRAGSGPLTSKKEPGGSADNAAL
jgi:hypothetical protein